MPFLFQLSLMGGIFAILTFIHFAVDWLFQSHSEAMIKHLNSKVRAKHCLIYTAGFIPLLAFCHLDWQDWFLSLNILFWSHFYLDTYHLVFLWAKYIRRPLEMTKLREKMGVDGHITLLPPDAKIGFVEFVQTALGKILMITIDQISHLSFLLPIAWMIMRIMFEEIR